MDINEFKKIKWKIANELIKKEYKIPSEELKNFLKKIRNFDLYITYEEEKEILIDLKDEEEKYHMEYKVANQMNSFVLEYPPILVGDKFYFFKPVMNLNYAQNKDEVIYSFYHELFHIISTSEWRYNIEKKYMQRNSGIIEECYGYENEEVKKISNGKENEKTYINEFINDFVSSYFFEKLEHKKGNVHRIAYDKRMLKKLKKYIGIEFDKDITGFIKSYILNELDFEKVELYLGEERER